MSSFDELHRKLSGMETEVNQLKDGQDDTMFHQWPEASPLPRPVPPVLERQGEETPLLDHVDHLKIMRFRGKMATGEEGDDEEPDTLGLGLQSQSFARPTRRRTVTFHVTDSETQVGDVEIRDLVLEDPIGEVNPHSSVLVFA